MNLVPRLGSGIPMVGRADELRRLRAALTRVAAGQATAVLLDGDAGVGKTRLVTELVTEATQRGALVLTGRCLDVGEGGLPYLPFAEALAPLVTSDDEEIAGAVRDRPALGRLLPQIPGPSDGAQYPRSAAAEHEQRRVRTEQDLGELQLFDGVLGVLTEIAACRSVVLVLEDLHWADGSTRNLVSFLLSRLTSQRLLVIGTYREEDVHRRHPLHGLLAELVRLPAVERIGLRPLPDADARAFVEALADEPLPGETVAEVVRRCQGNPFFAEELLASCADCPDIPSGLANVLLARLERLAPDTRRVLRTIAVASDRVAHAALAEVSGLDEFELDEALREAVQHHVLVIERGAYQFRHALLQEAVYSDLLPGERTRMHAAYAARLKAKPPGRGHDATLAYHSLRSKDFGTALAASVRAAGEAERLGAPRSALRHVEQALELWDAVPASERLHDCDEVALLLHASDLAGRSGEPERAIAFARSAVESLGPELDADRAAAAWRRLAEALAALDRTFTEAVDAIGRAWELVAGGTPSPGRAWVLATRAQILRGVERFEEASWNARTAVEDARAVGARAPEAAALITLGAFADSAGQAQEARRLLRDAERRARSAGALDVELRAVYSHALSYDDQADLTSAIALYQRAVARAEESGLRWSSFGLASRLRLISLRYVVGDWPAEDDREPQPTVSSTVNALLTSAWVHLVVARGGFDEADRLVEDLRTHWRSDVWIALAAGAAGVELAFWQGEHRQAADRAREALGWLDELAPSGLGGIRIGALGVEACAAWATHARLRGDRAGVEEAAAAGERLGERVRLYGERGRPRSGTLGPEGRAWLARADAAAGGLAGPAEPGLWAKAVEAFGYGAVYEQAVCRLHHAEALLVAGEAAAAAEQVREAAAVARRLGAVPLRDALTDLARRAKIDVPGETTRSRRARANPLTDRERAVLERVAMGRTNRQVGEELFISEKTVSVHLSRAMAKLGASRRAEAVAIAHDRGLLTTR